MRKVICVFVCVLLLSALLPAAGRPDASGTDGATITHWYWADTHRYGLLMKEIAAEFNATNGKGITVIADDFPWEGGRYFEQIFTAKMGGGGPDTSMWRTNPTPLFTANNLLADLAPFVNSWADKDQIDENYWEIVRRISGGNRMYTIFWNTPILYVYYRPSMLRAAGIGVPRNYQEFLDACRLLTRDGVYGFGMRGGSGGQDAWANFIYARGGSFDRLDSPESIQGMRDFVSLFTNGYAPPTAPTDAYTEIITSFRNGMTAMTLHHIGTAVDMENTFGDDVGAFAFPIPWAMMGETTNVMFESTRNKEAAFEWLAYLTTGKGQEMWSVGTGNIPICQRTQQLPFFQNSRFVRASLDAAPYADIFPVLPNSAEFVSSVWSPTVAGALTGRISVEEAMRTMQRRLHGN